MPSETDSILFPKVLLLAVGLLVAGMTAPLVAQQSTAAQVVPPEKGAPEGAAPDTTSPSRGVRAFIDPATGRITATPSPEQLAALEALERQTAQVRNKSSIGLAVTPLAMGGYEVDLQDRFVSSTIVIPTSSSSPTGLDFICIDREPTGRDVDSSGVLQAHEAPLPAMAPATATATASGPAPNLPSADQ